MYYEKLKNRTEAGQLLAKKLLQYQNGDSVVLAIPRGGVPVGYEIAKELHLPLDIIFSKKIGHPNNKEFAIGAVALDSVIVDENTGVSADYIQKEVLSIQQNIRKKYKLYKGNKEPLDLKNKNVILVDDGIATGNTLLVCLDIVRKKNPAKIIIAIPVLPFDTLSVFKKNTDELIYLIAAHHFSGISSFYNQSEQVGDEEAIQMLNYKQPHK